MTNDDILKGLQELEELASERADDFAYYAELGDYCEEDVSNFSARWEQAMATLAHLREVVVADAK